MKLLWLLCWVVLARGSEETPCDERSRVELPSQPDSPEPEGYGITFDNTTSWHENGKTFGCPCEVVDWCLRLCRPNESSHYANTMANVSKVDGVFKIGSIGDVIGVFFLLGATNTDGYCSPEFEHDLMDGGYLIKANHGLNHEEFCVLIEDDRLHILVDCEHNKEPEDLTLHAVFASISIFFLLLVVLVFVVVPKTRTLQSRIYTCQSATLALGQTGLVIFYTSDLIIGWPCQMIGYLTHFFLLSSFCWLTTLCFDMSGTFSALDKMAAASSKLGRSNFRFYAMFSTFLPLSFTSLVIILNHSLGDGDKLWPNIGISGCWFKDKLAQGIYFQGPLLLLILTNSVFFVTILVRICQFRRDSACLDSTSGNRNHRKKETWQNVMLAIKLFLLVGCTWIMEVLSWAVEGDKHIWIIFDLINLLRGPVFFYFCVVGNVRARRAIRARIWPEASWDSRNASFRTTFSNSSTRDHSRSMPMSTIPDIQ